jgi:hypothetical protein
MTAKARAALHTDIDAKVTTNGAQENTGSRVRVLLEDFLDSVIMPEDDGGAKELGLVAFESDENVTVGDGTQGIPVPASLNGMNIIAVLAIVHTKGVTGTTDVQVRRRRAGSNVDVLSTKVTIGDEWQAADGVINASNDDLATGDLLFVDVDAIHSGTAPVGLSVAITAKKPAV